MSEAFIHAFEAKDVTMISSKSSSPKRSNANAASKSTTSEVNETLNSNIRRHSDLPQVERQILDLPPEMTGNFIEVADDYVKSLLHKREQQYINERKRLELIRQQIIDHKKQAALNVDFCEYAKCVKDDDDGSETNFHRPFRSLIISDISDEDYVIRGLPPDLMGRNITTCHSTVSSLSTTDSYIKKQSIREIHRKIVEGKKEAAFQASTLSSSLRSSGGLHYSLRSSLKIGSHVSLATDDLVVSDITNCNNRGSLSNRSVRFDMVDFDPAPAMTQNVRFNKTPIQADNPSRSSSSSNSGSQSRQSSSSSSQNAPILRNSSNKNRRSTVDAIAVPGNVKVNHHRGSDVRRHSFSTSSHDRSRRNHSFSGTESASIRSDNQTRRSLPIYPPTNDMRVPIEVCHVARRNDRRTDGRTYNREPSSSLTSVSQSKQSHSSISDDKDQTKRQSSSDFNRASLDIHLTTNHHRRTSASKSDSRSSRSHSSSTGNVSCIGNKINKSLRRSTIDAIATAATHTASQDQTVPNSTTHTLTPNEITWEESYNDVESGHHGSHLDLKVYTSGLLGPRRCPVKKLHNNDTDDDSDNSTLSITLGSSSDSSLELEEEAERQLRRYARRLAGRACHFPGNTWFEDWLQYMSNTHLFFGIFFHHKLHPVTRRERCVILLGSAAVGSLISNLIYLWFLHANFGMNDLVFKLPGNVDVTKLMITLWTLGCVVHSLFDLSLWHIAGCTLFRYYRDDNYVSDDAVRCGRVTGMTIVFGTLAFSTYLVLVRATEDYKNSIQIMDNIGSSGSGEVEDVTLFMQANPSGIKAKHYAFLLGYFFEFILAVFIYNPLILTIVFTGVLGNNGRVPVLGGRPREVMMEEQFYAMKQQKNSSLPQKRNKRKLNDKTMSFWNSTIIDVHA